MSSTKSLSTSSLGFLSSTEGGDTEDAVVVEQPMRVLRLPFCGTVLSWGDDGDGQLSAKAKANTNTNTNTTNDGNDKGFQIIYRFDDLVRAVAVSDDAKRIAIGFDDGSTKVYTFDDHDHEDLTSGALHPFCHKLASSPSKPRQDGDGDDDDDDDDELMTQDFQGADLASFAGPQFELPIRDLQFVPSAASFSPSTGSASTSTTTSTTTTTDYWLAIASESGLCLVNATSPATLTERALQHEVEEHHAHGGIRGVACCCLGHDGVMATLALDGRLCLWQNRTLLQREATTCIPKKDVGEVHGADPYDRSCRPILWKEDGVHDGATKTTKTKTKATTIMVATPGQLLPQLRRLHSSNNSNSNSDDKAQLQVQPIKVECVDQDKGHMESIVAIQPLKGGFLLTSGRDKRLILWKMTTTTDTDGSSDFASASTQLTPLETWELPSVATDLLVVQDQGQGEDKDNDNEKVWAACAKGTYTVVDLAVHLRDQEGMSSTSTSTSTSSRSKQRNAAAVKTNPNTNATSSTTTTLEHIDPLSSSIEAESNDDDDDDVASPSKPPKKKSLQTIIPADLDDSDDDKDEKEADLAQVKKSPSSTPSSSPKKKPLKTKMGANNDNHNHNHMDDDDDDDSDVDFGNADDTDDAAPKNRVRFVDDEAAEDDEDEKDTAKAGNPKEGNTNDLDDDDDDDSLEDVRPSQTTIDALDEAMEDLEDGGEEAARFMNQRVMAAVPTIPAQPAFSPSSTPLDLSRRYLCWNHIGAITLLQGDDRNTVDISFTNSAYKRPISFTDNMNFIVGSLGDDGGVFATDLQGDDDDDLDGQGNDGFEGLQMMSEQTKRAVRKSQKKGFNKATGSAIFFYRFETFGNLREKDWYLTLPDGERVLGTATGAGWAAVVTSRQFLRFYTSGGNQSQVLWLKGDPVTMTGRGRFMVVVYHEAAPRADGTQQLGYALWDASNFEVISRGSLSCLSKGASLTWVGFSNDCSLMAMDSEGILSMLVQAGSTSTWEWSPVLDTIGLRKSKEDQFWPVTVYDGKLVCVPLKGGNSCPDAGRRPVTSTLGLRLPLAASSVAKTSILEEVNVRSNMALNQKRFVNELEGDAEEQELEQEFLTMSAQVDKVTLKLFAALVDANKLERALDLVDRLHLEKSYDLAVRLADRHHKLADFIEEAKERKFPIEEELEGEDEEEEHQNLPETSFMDRLAPSRQISPEASHVATKRAMLARQGGTSFMGAKTKKQRME